MSHITQHDRIDDLAVVLFQRAAMKMLLAIFTVLSLAAIVGLCAASGLARVEHATQLAARV